MHSKPHIAILGAGPTGLEAALAVAEAGYPFTLYEAARKVAGGVRSWGHVQLFSPWSLDVSPRMRRHLEAAGHEVPDGDACPTGRELAERAFDAAAALPEIAPHLRLGARVLRVGREGLLKQEAIGTGERAARPFRLLVQSPEGEERVEEAAVVLDCTGSYGHANALGDGGIPAPGEAAARERIRRTLPDLEAEAEAWAGQRILLAGAGYSAQTAARDLAALAAGHEGTQVTWILRRPEAIFPFDPEDALPLRAELSRAAQALAEGGSPTFEVRPGRVVEAIRGGSEGPLTVVLRRSGGGTEEIAVDRILSLTGYVGDHELYRQLQVHECYATSGPMKLAAALLGAAGGGGDCLAQESLGAETLRNPEPNFFILGAKSYGRNSSFLMRLGWAQVDEVLELLP
jgi:cation diffusion facilitator CzcD-associated flavoprotein CzcO